MKVSQRAVADWVRNTFGQSVLEDRQERALRVLEEALELAQAAGVPFLKVLAMHRHVYNRPVGEIKQEAGGLGVTLLAFAEAYGFDLDDVVYCEYKRVMLKPARHFQDRQAAKVSAGISTVVESIKDTKFVNMTSNTENNDWSNSTATIMPMTRLSKPETGKG